LSNGVILRYRYHYYYYRSTTAVLTLSMQITVNIFKQKSLFCYKNHYIDDLLMSMLSTFFIYSLLLNINFAEDVLNRPI